METRLGKNGNNRRMTPGLHLKKPKITYMRLLFFYQGEYRQSAVYFVTDQDIYGLHLRTHITNKNQEQPAIPAVVDKGKNSDKSANSYHYYISKGKYWEKLQYLLHIMTCTSRRTTAGPMPRAIPVVDEGKKLGKRVNWASEGPTAWLLSLSSTVS